MTRNVAYLLKGASTLLACALACALALGVGLAPGTFAKPVGPVPARAFADEPESDATKTAYELQLQIEEAQAAFAAVKDEVDQANRAIEKNRQRIAQLEEEIPLQQERSARAARELYKFQQQSVGLIDMLLAADSLGDFLKEFEYISTISDANVREMSRLGEMRQEVEAAQVELRQAYNEASVRAEEADEALTSLEEAQAEVQRRIEEEARQAAEIAAQAQANAENPRTNDQGSIADVDSGDAVESGGGSPGSESSGGNVNAPEPASSDEAAFIAQWAPRIDAYLAGSPLAGQGATFASAAYRYNVDPRWSPAISFTESSKGAYCFLPYNAWGWGSVSWSSWAEAIDAHVGGLSRGYGYTISIEAAKKYCPPNYQHWYDRTLAQMNMI